MATLLARVAIPQTSGLPDDLVVNDFVIADNNNDVELNGPLPVTAAIEGFYNDQYMSSGAMHSPSEFLSPVLSRAALACEVKYYDLTGALDGSPVGSPIATDRFTLGAAIGTALPSEVACVMTLRGQDWDQVAINVPGGVAGPEGDQRPRQRHSGKLYLGPLSSTAVAADGVGRARPSGQLRGTLLNAAFHFQEELELAAGGDFHWVVWSRKDAAVRRIVRVEVDDAFDTQRRRGEAATTRDVQAMPAP